MSVYMGIKTYDLFFYFYFSNDSVTCILFTDVMKIRSPRIGFSYTVG